MNCPRSWSTTRARWQWTGRLFKGDKSEYLPGFRLDRHEDEFCIDLVHIGTSGIAGSSYLISFCKRFIINSDPWPIKARCFIKPERGADAPQLVLDVCQAVTFDGELSFV